MLKKYRDFKKMTDILNEMPPFSEDGPPQLKEMDQAIKNARQAIHKKDFAKADRWINKMRKIMNDPAPEVIEWLGPYAYPN